jgi:tellurite resistance protein TehA-like permease
MLVTTVTTRSLNINVGPLGQGGFSLLINGQNFSHIFPLYMNNQFPFVNQSGDMVFAVSFVGSYILWSMGAAWIILALASIFSVVKKTRVPFSMAYWGMVFPNGTYALLSCQLGIVLDSPFFRVIGAVWCSEHRYFFSIKRIN